MLALLVVLVMGTDTVLTIFSVRHFHTTTQQWEQRAVAYREKLKQRLATGLPKERPALAQRLANWHTDLVKRRAELRLRRLNWNERRLVKSFPKLKVLDAKHFNELKKDLMKKE